MNEVLEKLIKKYISGPTEPNINYNQASILAKDIAMILERYDVFIEDVDTAGQSNKITLKNGNGEFCQLPEDIVDIVDFWKALPQMKDTFPYAEKASERIENETFGLIYFNKTWNEEPHLKCNMITRDGEYVELKLLDMGNADSFYYDGTEIILFDKQGNRYIKNPENNTVYLNDAEPSHEFPCGKLDVKALWESLEDVPLNPETEKLEAPWFKFKEGTEKEEIWKWFEQELQVSVHDLMHDMKKVDKMLLSFDKEKFNLKEDRKFSRKKLEGTQSLVR